MTNAVTLVVECGESEPGELVAQTALGDAPPADGGQRNQTLVSLPRGLAVQVVPLLIVHGRLLLNLVHEGRDERVHLNCLSGKHLGHQVG